MRVAVVTKHFPNSEQKWAGHSVYQTLRVLATLCDLHVFYPEVRYPAWLTPRSQRELPLDRSWSPEGVPSTYIPFAALPIVSRPLNGGVIARRLLPHVAKFQPEILLSYFVYPDGYAAIRIGRELGVPVVVTAVGSDINRIADPLLRLLTRYTLRNAAFVSTVSQDLCDKARSMGADPARSAPKLNGCDTSVFYPRDRQEARQSLALEPNASIVLYVGRLDVRKGLIELVEAIVKLIPQRPDLHCYFVGSGPDGPAILQAISRYQAEARLTVVPPDSTARVALWMAAADLVALPSYAEGCPNVLIEALAAGRPVVATNVGGIPEIVDSGCGQLVPPHDPSAVAEALDAVLERPWDAEDIAAKHARSWQTVAAELHQILEQSIAAKAK